MSGYVRIHRTLIGHPVFRNDAEAMVFAWLITQAQWKPTRVRYKDHIIKLERGQLAISLRDLAHRFDRDKAWISRLLKRLQNESMIETTGETGVNVISICNYGEYQAEPVLCETPRETQDETDARQVRDTEQVREQGKKESSEAKASSQRGKHMIPSDWTPPPVSELPPRARACVEQWTDASYQTEAEAFVCYWRSERRMKADWRDTWANRIIARHSAIMRDQKFGNAAPMLGGGKKSPAEYRAYCLEQADRCDRMQRRDEAAEWRRKAQQTQQAA